MFTFGLPATVYVSDCNEGEDYSFRGTFYLSVSFTGMNIESIARILIRQYAVYVLQAKVTL